MDQSNEERSVFMIELLAIDMDGTLLSDRHRISERTMQALHRAAEAGITVVPTTGRAIAALPHQIVGESFYRYVISSNGACTTDLAGNRELYEAKLPCTQTTAFLRQCASLRNVGVSAHVDHEFILEGEILSRLGRLTYGKDAKNTICCRDLAAELERRGSDVEELQLFFFSRSARESLKALLDMNPWMLQAWDSPYVELYAPRASKGNALTALAESLKIPKERVACIGDAENDFSMFDASGVRFAMGNGIDALKARADHVLPGNNEDGVAAAIDLILGE